MSESMSGYTGEDFMAYFGQAAMLHPVTGTICYLSEIDSEGMCSVRSWKRGSLAPIHYSTLSFATFNNYPRLGYRHVTIDDVTYLYYITHIARRQRGKGLRSNTVIVNQVPEVSRLCTLAKRSGVYRTHQSLNAFTVDAIFQPKYATLETACAVLLNTEERVLGIALSPSIAITFLTTNEEEPLLMLFKEQRVASSKDGVTWKATHEEYATLLKRSIPSIQLEIDNA